MKRKPSYPCKHEASMKNRGDFMGKLGKLQGLTVQSPSKARGGALPISHV